MPKKDIGFRFSEQTHAQLLELSRRWGCTRTEVIEQLVDNEFPVSSAKQASEGVVSREPVHSARALVESERPRVAVGRLRPAQTSSTITGRPHGPVPKGKK